MFRPRHPRRNHQPRSTPGPRLSGTSCTSNSNGHQVPQSISGLRPLDTSNASDAASTPTKAFQHFITSKCIDQAFSQPSQTHPSHCLWQKGEKVPCTNCGCQSNLDGELRIITNQVLTKVCKGAATKGSPPLSEFFKKKGETLSQQNLTTSMLLDMKPPTAQDLLHAGCIFPPPLMTGRTGLQPRLCRQPGPPLLWP